MVQNTTRDRVEGKVVTPEVHFRGRKGK